MSTGLRSLGIVLLNLGLDPRKLVFLKNIPRFLSQVRAFRQQGGKVSHVFPILSEYDDQAGSAQGHYFHQDLLVASFIHQRKPQRHVDVGSRIDGFVAHVAAFRPVEVMDVRALKDTGHENIRFLKADLMDERVAPSEIADSVSCLHAIEHFGLGRYGDPLDPLGHRKGFNNILRMLKPGGMLYISFPIARANEVHFNAHRAFEPLDVFNWATDPDSLELVRFDFVNDAGALQKNVDIRANTPDVTHGCGIYSFKKLR